MRWHVRHRFDAECRELADRHYNRQKVGNPQFAPPGRCLVLLAKTETSKALWVSSQQDFVLHAWPNAWNNSCFRNEGAGLSSELIREAIAATRWWWGEVPENGFITFVDAGKIRRKRDPGRCYRKAGFQLIGETKVSKLLVFQLTEKDMPEPCAPQFPQLGLFGPSAYNGQKRS